MWLKRGSCLPVNLIRKFGVGGSLLVLDVEAGRLEGEAQVDKNNNEQRRDGSPNKER
jgi:hypothetical protein